ncbi:hypothetical protein [Nonomuraea salmonea]|uniref:hypothetical protein n=1 Tax=Nonomuraea salmonea TaxID=46181 RepID=UPI0031E934F3
MIVPPTNRFQDISRTGVPTCCSGRVVTETSSFTLCLRAGSTNGRLRTVPVRL